MERRSIPARFDGTLYRSHLEARWAIFLTQLDVKFTYEPQGFDLGDGSAYLPDFAIYAACGTIWAEVKPEWDADPEGMEKWRRFATVRPQPSRAALLVGPPSADRSRGMHTVIGGVDPAGTDDPLKGPWEDGNYAWRPCAAGYHFDLAYYSKFPDDGCPQHGGWDGHDRIEAAVSAAMSHRFGKFGTGKAA
jgi:hypothetical protein